MKHSLKTGLGFGITSGAITTLGLLVGLHSGTCSKLVIIGGILTIAIADSCSDALGIYVSKKFEDRYPIREVWKITIVTFLSQFFISLSFIIPILFLSISTAVIVSIWWGLFVLSYFSYYVAKQIKARPLYVIIEHLFIAIIVLIGSSLVGHLIKTFFV
ncbi:hypothetical protein KAT08_00975 [Candidatus Babeliales bacterium]|nr:hypothetical protein [Candidatus Babeliales bacterium]